MEDSTGRGLRTGDMVGEARFFEVETVEKCLTRGCKNKILKLSRARNPSLLDEEREHQALFEDTFRCRPAVFEDIKNHLALPGHFQCPI